MKKLIPALALLLISAVVLSTSSFAWFSMNTKVSANGMEVKAAASRNLLISDTSGSGYKSTVGLAKEVATMVPTSTVPATSITAPTFYKVDSVGAIKTDDGAYTPTTTFTAATANTDYLATAVYLKATGSTGVADGKLKATIGVTYDDGAAASPLDPSLRVMLVVSEVGTPNTFKNAVIIAPVTGGSSSYSGINGVTGAGETLTADTDLTAITLTANASFINSGYELTADKEYKVDIYVWFEGQDVTCKSSNAINLVNINLTIDFEATN